MSCTKAYSLFKPVFKFVCLQQPFVRFIRVVWTKRQPRGYDESCHSRSIVISSLKRRFQSRPVFSYSRSISLSLRLQIFSRGDTKRIEMRNRNRTIRGMYDRFESGFSTALRRKKCFSPPVDEISSKLCSVSIERDFLFNF